MNAVIRERAKVDSSGSVTIADPRLKPGDEVEVTVRPIDKAVATLRDVARTVRIDAPPDYSESFEDALRPQP
jgi:hypothetical protein